MAKRKVILRSSDGEDFEVEYEVALQMECLTEEVLDNNEKLPLLNVSSSTLRKVIQYINFHLEASISKKAVEDVKIWDTQFVNVDRQTLFDLLMAADYLNVEKLFDFICETMADRIKDLSIQKIRQLFGKRNDFTPEEERKMRSETEWAFR